LRPAIHRSVGVFLVLALATGARPARAQWTVRGTAILSVMRHRVDAGYGVEPTSGVLGGAEVAVGLGDRLTVRLLTETGSLHADAPGAIDRDVAAAGVQVDVAALRWLTFEVGARRRTYSTVLARQPWTTLALGAAAHVPFSETGLTGILRGAILPGVWVNGLGQPDLAFAVASGMEYRRGRASVSVLYSLERYRFAPTAAGGATAERREQLAGLILSVGWSVKR
jgi:hypothetical protein